MAYARQVELVDLSRTRPLPRPRSVSGYTPCESLSSPTATSDSSEASNMSIVAAHTAYQSDQSEHTDHQNKNEISECEDSAIPKANLDKESCSTSPTFVNSANNGSAGDVVSAQISHALTGSHPNQSATSGAGSEFRSSATFESDDVPVETQEEIFRLCVEEPTVDVDELRRIVWIHGAPSATWARPLAWKLLTGYLPPDHSDWDSTLSTKRERYWATVLDVTVDPSERPVDGDHPLNDAASSQWREYFDDSDVRTVIKRDVKRTHPDLHRFAPLRDSLERILFVYAKGHKTLGYRQGMNELAAPFLLVFSDVRGVDMSDVEADAYFCFENVMSEMTTCYITKETESDGIGRQLRELQALLRIKDPELEQRLESLGIDPRFYGLRWIRLWVCHEFSLPDCLSLWDSFLTAEVRLPWIRYVCVAMLIRIRQHLLQSDFTACMKLLLNYPGCDVTELLRIADRLRTSNAVIVRTSRG